MYLVLLVLQLFMHLQPPIILVYSRQLDTPDTYPLLAPSPFDPISSNHDPSLDLPVTLCKGKRQFTYPIFNFDSYAHLSFSSNSFIASLYSVFIPKTVFETLSYLDWHAAIVEDKVALDDNGTWDLVKLPKGKK